MKTYVGISRPMGQYNKNMLSLIESNLQYFNGNKRKGILTVEHYVDGGDQWKLLKDGKRVLDYMTLEECSKTVSAIINYTEVK